MEQERLPDLRRQRDIQFLDIGINYMRRQLANSHSGETEAKLQLIVRLREMVIRRMEQERPADAA